MDGACLPCSVSFVLKKPNVGLSHVRRIPCRQFGTCVFAHTRTHDKNAVFQSRSENIETLRSCFLDTGFRLKAFKGFQDNLSTETQSKECPCIGLFSAKLENGFYTEEGVWMSELEFKVLHFMETSGNPFSFPTQSQLLEAGRGDLVEAILHEGGWLASGWDSNSRASTDKDNVTEDMHLKVPNGEAGNPAVEERQKAWDRVADLFGLVKPLKKGMTGKSLEGDNQKPNMNSSQGSIPSSYDDQRNLKRNIIPQCETSHNTIKESCNRMYELVNARKEVFRNARNSREKRNQETNDPVSIAHRIQGLEAELTTTLHMLQTGRDALAHDIKPNQIDDTKFHNIEEPSESMDNLYELEVSRKRPSGNTLAQQDSIWSKLSHHEIEEASDELEFRETELLRKGRELREAQAKLTMSEGKLALQLTELQRNIKDKDKRLNEAMSVLKTMRTVRIVWPNPGIDVLLAGSFDGWTSQRKMEKSSAGVFVTSLQLYPGRYEIKFIVNGEWKVDHNRPITGEGGFENNVLIIV